MTSVKVIDYFHIKKARTYMRGNSFVSVGKYAKEMLELLETVHQYLQLLAAWKLSSEISFEAQSE